MLKSAVTALCCVWWFCHALPGLSASVGVEPVNPFHDIERIQNEIYCLQAQPGFDEKQSLVLWNSAVKKYPWSAYLRLDRGRTLSYFGKTDEALEDLHLAALEPQLRNESYLACAYIRANRQEYFGAFQELWKIPDPPFWAPDKRLSENKSEATSHIVQGIFSRFGFAAAKDRQIAFGTLPTFLDLHNMLVEKAVEAKHILFPRDRNAAAGVEILKKMIELKTFPAVDEVEEITSVKLIQVSPADSSDMSGHNSFVRVAYNLRRKDVVFYFNSEECEISKPRLLKQFKMDIDVGWKYYICTKEKQVCFLCLSPNRSVSFTSFVWKPQ